MGRPERPSKLDLPFETDEQIAGMVEAFERCAWPYARWTHRAHLALAVHYLRRLTPAEALERTRRQIQLYNRTCGDPDGYHETLTVLFLRRVDHHLRTDGRAATEAEAVEALAILCDARWPLVHYSADRLWSAEARQGWVEPDRAPLDF